MDSKISALENEYALLQRKRDAVEENMSGIFAKIERLRKERDQKSDKLTPEEELEFRYALTIVGELLENENVLFGGVYILDEEPNKEDIHTGYFGDSGPRKYSIAIETHFVLDVSPGLSVNVKIKTKTPAIKRIVQDMVESTEYVREEEKLVERTSWRIDWDYHDRITIKNKVTQAEYFKKK